MIALVVIRHALQYSVADEGGILTNIIWAVQMPGFMLVSGYFSARAVNSFSEIKKSCKKSLERYLLPFITWFFLIECLLIGKFDRNVLKAFSVLVYHVDDGLWFLWVIFVLSVLATVCNYFCTTRRKTISKIGFSLVSCSVYFGMFLALMMITKSTSFIGCNFILYYAVFYFFGWLVNKTEDYIKPFCRKYSNVVLFACLVIFLTIVFNYDLYHCKDDIMSIALRCLAGFTGNVVILGLVVKNKNFLINLKLDRLGLYTLEIYATHMGFNHLMTADSANNFFTVMGFSNFTISLILTVSFTAVIITVIRSIPFANYLLYGKKSQ